MIPYLQVGSGRTIGKALAEDVVRGFAEETDCIFIMRERVRKITQELYDISKKYNEGRGMTDEEMIRAKELSGQLLELEHRQQSGYNFNVAEMERY